MIRRNTVGDRWPESLLKAIRDAFRHLANGITRNAVLGKVHRLGLSAGSSGRPPKRPAVRPTTPRVARTRSQVIRLVDAPPKAAIEHGLVTLLSVRRCQCRWPFGEPGAAEFSLCGRPVQRGAFCAPHAAIAYRPTRETRQSLERLARID